MGSCDPTRPCVHNATGPGTAVIAIDRDGGLTWITLADEIDAARALELQHALAPLRGDVIVDCGQLTFLDSSAISVLVNAACSLAATDHLLTLVRVQSAVRRMLDILDLSELFGIVPAS